MTAMLADPGVITDGPRTQTVHLEREDIWFYDVSPDRVRIEITVRSSSGGRSAPTMLRLQAAPLGAFLPWTPLTTLHVPALEPGETVELRTDAPRPQPTPLGDFADVPPRKLLTAVSPGDWQSPPVESEASRSRRTPAALPARPFQSLADALTTRQLPADPFDLLGRSNPHWAGNINVFIGRKAVERHLAQALRVYPGRTNLAAFFVGTRRDAYAFDLKGDGADWNAALYDVTAGNSLLINRELDSPIRRSEWVEARGHLLMMLAVCPPDDCRQGNLEVHVTQRSTAKTSVVEFSLDPAAKGPGCYAV